MAVTAGVASTRAAMLPNGADPHQRQCWGSDINAATLVFIGNLYYSPNARAVEAIRSVILRALQEAELDVRVRVVGRGPASLTHSGHRIEFTGRVDTIDQALKGMTLALAPLVAGSGAKMKVLDYLAAGLPVLGTHEAVTGLPANHPGVIVEDDLHRWSPMLASLLQSPAELVKIGRAGRQSVERELSWQRIGADLTKHCRTWLTTLPPKIKPKIGRHCVGVPRWLTEHAAQNALGAPQITSPGVPRWLRRRTTTIAPQGCR